MFLNCLPKVNNVNNWNYELKKLQGYFYVCIRAIYVDLI